jgi:hypothetical protein
MSVLRRLHCCANELASVQGEVLQEMATGMTKIQRRNSGSVKERKSGLMEWSTWRMVCSSNLTRMKWR